MGYKFSPVGQGKNNNIHFRFTIKYNKINKCVYEEIRFILCSNVSVGR